MAPGPILVILAIVAVSRVAVYRVPLSFALLKEPAAITEPVAKVWESVRLNSAPPLSSVDMTWSPLKVILVFAA